MNELPITIDFGSLPNTGLGYSPQAFADRLGLNGRLFTEQDFALFATGSTAPTSDIGPWAKDGNSWYYWDTVSGSYIPFVIEPESLGYYIGFVAPDPTVYNFWIQTDAGGSPLSLRTYYSGNWVDVYATSIATFMTIAAFNAAIASYSTTAQMNAAISAALAPYLTTASAAATYQTIAGMASYLTTASAAATYQTIAGMASYLTTASAAATYLTIANAASTYLTSASAVFGKNIFKAYNSGTQAVVMGGAGNYTGQVNLGTETFDPDGNFSSSTFTAPSTGYYTFQANAFVSTSGTSPGDTLDMQINFAVNGTPIDDLTNPQTDGTAGEGVTGGTTVYLNSSDTVTLRYDFTASAAFTANIDSAMLTGFRVR